MATDELDLVDEILGSVARATPHSATSAGSAASTGKPAAVTGEPAAVTGEPASPESITWDRTSPPASSVAEEPESQIQVRHPLARAGSKTGSKKRRAVWAVKLVLTFVIAAIATLVLVAAVALVAFSQFKDRTVPGTRVGTVDVSGLSRDQLIAKLQTSYAYLGLGEVSVTTPVGVAKITYEQAGRGPDVEAMADAAMRIGHTGNAIDDAVFMLRSAIDGQSVPIVVRVDPTAVATNVRQLLGKSSVPPTEAQVSNLNGTFALWQSTPGGRIDETVVCSAIVDLLAQSDAPAAVQVGDALVALNPKITSQDAQAAADAAERMAVALNLTWGGASPTASPSQTSIPSQTYTIDSKTVRGWISFGLRADGTYAPSVDIAPIQAYLSELSPKVATKPVEPSVVFDSAGKPSGVKNGKDGASIDVAATSQAVMTYLGSLASGANPGPSVAIVTSPISPRITPTSLSGMVVIGAWTTIFYPDISNGNGANIRVPANIFNGQIVEPGKQFSFLRYVGPVDRAHGFTLGGVIKDGKSDHTGAMGGGICSASTTMFNAAARAGLKIDERHAHYYYIYRYPVGLDATVYSSGGQTWDLKWTNDTANPIVIRGWTTRGSKSTITIQLWSMPLDRKVTFSPEYKASIVKASDRTVYVSNLKPGQQNRAEYPTMGFYTSRTRTVTDSTGKVIHLDTWSSHYSKVDGLLQIGRAKPAPSPTPGAQVPAGDAPATLAPAPNPIPAPRRRRAH